jgi:hypothetical protein
MPSVQATESKRRYVIATGTNHGRLNPFMDGDVVELETQGLGRLKISVHHDLKRTWAGDTRVTARSCRRSRRN